MQRFLRQLCLAEVGEAGQAKIAGLVCEVAGSDGSIIETEYLCRAGVERLTLLPRHEPEPFSHENAFRFAASRRVGAGAWRALRKIRRALEERP